ncbi:MAG: M24 family metallopeptidase [Candidatus Promineifilaceae bacterium]
MNQGRIDQLRQRVLAHGLDGVALMPGPNLLYLSGIRAHASERPMLLFLPADDEPAAIFPLLEADKARAAGVAPERLFIWSDEEGYTGAFQAACAALELSDYLLGVEALHMRLLEVELLHRYAPGLTTAHLEPIMAVLRLRKDSHEIDAMHRAAKVAEAAMRRLLPQIKVGQTEHEIAGLLVQALYAAGSQAIPFGPIVQAGPNSGSPHAPPSDRPIQVGDLLLIDWGAVVDGYPSDISRTFAVGPIRPELERVYELVKAANAAGRDAAAPGASGQDVDRAARELIAAGGYADAFLHRTGHGLGLEVHEPPYIMEGNLEPLEPGAVFTVEPGIYLEGRGGVRIEDDVVVTAGVSQSLTSLSRDLIRVG